MTSHRGAACSACGVLLAARHGRNARHARNARSRVAKAGAGWSCWFMLEVKAHMAKYVALCSIWPPSTTFNYQTTIFYSVTFCFWIWWVPFEAFVVPKRPGLKWFTSKIDGATGKTWNNWNLECPAKRSNIIALWSCPMRSYEILTSHGGCSPHHGPGCCSDLRGRREGGGGDRGRRKALGVSEVRCPVQGWYICSAVVPDCEMTYAMPAKNAA